jgi:uroporphyrinogen decarboxylase
MRQAGRYMADYRALRQRYSMLELCRSPELATQVTLQPVEALDIDAAILFSDLLLPLEPMGLPFDFVKGEGPAIERPLRSAADVERLKVFEPRDELGHVLESIRLVRRALDGRLPLIGFGGAPFTLASYAIEGGSSRSYQTTKALMYGDPQTWHRLCDTFATVMASFLAAQVEAGAQAIQLFDSWVGHLSAADYREFVAPHTRRIFAALEPLGVPTIHFGVGTSTLLAEMREAGGDVIGADWRIPLDEAWALVGHDRAIQGNLDPTLLLGPAERLLAAAGDVLERAAGRPGHIFNLGHGILPTTPLEHVQILARYVHRKSALHN